MRGGAVAGGFFQGGGVENAAGGDIRQCAAELIDTAAELGIARPWTLTELSPREIEWSFRALAARRQKEAEMADLSAYLAGRYMLVAFHAPKRYPREPEGVARPPKKMTDHQMKQFFAELAAGKEAENGDC